MANRAGNTASVRRAVTARGAAKPVRRGTRPATPARTAEARAAERPSATRPATRSKNVGKRIAAAAAGAVDTLAPVVVPVVVPVLTLTTAHVAETAETAEAAQAEAPDYETFLAGKHLRDDWHGFEVDARDLNPHLFDWQRQIVRWACHKGRAALLEACGCGKTIQMLEWARQVHRHTGGDVLILAPLAVAAQTQREGEKFGIPVTICRTQADVRPGINITNYEMLSHFDAAHFVGVVLDEATILCNYMGVTKRALVEAFRQTPYRLLATATPAPNDHTEIGNLAEFLGIMPSYEMLTRWFVNDSKETGVYRLKGHAEADFWAWVASWGVCVERPSDLGYSDEGFVLPPLSVRDAVVRLDLTQGAEDGQLFRAPTLNATSMHREMRRTAAPRADAVQVVVDAWEAEDRVAGNDVGDAGGTPQPTIIWCNTDYEQRELDARFGDRAISVYGSQSVREKERRILAWLHGERPIFISKPTVAGLGMNFQHCHRVVFIGLSYSFKEYYQALRRVWRYGQTRAVRCVIVAGETEGAVHATVARKEMAHERMSAAMRKATREAQDAARRTLDAYQPRMVMRLPAWLRSVSECEAATEKTGRGAA